METQIKGRDILIYLSLKYDGDWNKIYEAIKAKELVDATYVQERVKSVGSQVCTIIDDDYPETLKRIYKPPFVIFYYGKLSKLSEKQSITILSTPKTSLKSLQRSRNVANALATPFNVVTIMDDGANLEIAKEAASKEALVAVGFQGIDRMKAELKTFSHSDRNLILSEIPGELGGHDDGRAWSTRLASSLGEKLLITEIKYKSYESLAIGYFMYLDKQVMSLLPMSGTVNQTQRRIMEDSSIIKVARTSEVIKIMTTTTPPLSA
jgi:DNA processing protein